MVNQIPAIINTNPPEPKSSDPELYEVKLDVISCIPSNNFGKEQFEIEAKAEEIDKYYSKKYWIPQSMGRVENNNSYTVAMRRRRLGQTREGVIKEGRNADGSFIKHNWDWEIMAITEYEGSTSQAQPTQEPKDFLTEPKEAPMQVTSQTTVTNKDQQIARSVALKAAVDIEVAKLDNKLADGSNSMEDIVTNADNFYGYLVQ